MAEIGEIYAGKQFTGPQTLTVQQREGWKKMSVLVTDDSTGNLLVRGNKLTVDGIALTLFGQVVSASDEATIEAGQSITLGIGNSSVDNLELQLESGCTIEVVAVTSKNIIGPE